MYVAKNGANSMSFIFSVSVSAFSASVSVKQLIILLPFNVT